MVKGTLKSQILQLNVKRSGGWSVVRKVMGDGGDLHARRKKKGKNLRWHFEFISYSTPTTTSASSRLPRREKKVSNPCALETPSESKVR